MGSERGQEVSLLVPPIRFSALVTMVLDWSGVVLFIHSTEVIYAQEPFAAGTPFRTILACQSLYSAPSITCVAG